jgi:hypothetical protein
LERYGDWYVTHISFKFNFNLDSWRYKSPTINIWIFVKFCEDTNSILRTNMMCKIEMRTGRNWWHPSSMHIGDIQQELLPGDKKKYHSTTQFTDLRIRCFRFTLVLWLYTCIFNHSHNILVLLFHIFFCKISVRYFIVLLKIKCH